MIEFGRILCPLDLSEFSQHTVAHALALAGWYKARLTLLYVYVNRPTMDAPLIELQPDERRRLVDELRGLVAVQPPGLQIDYRVAEAFDARQEILRQIGETRADLLVIGSHGRSGFQTFLLGSVTEKIIRQAPCPVMVVPRRAPDAGPSAPMRYARILCPVDFSDGSLNALSVALRLAQEASAHLTVLHAIEHSTEIYEDMSAADTVEIDRIRASAHAAALRRLRSLVPAAARTYCTIEATVVHGPPHREILNAAAADRSELIVMGVQGRGAVNLLLFGSNTARVMRGAVCPVLTVRLGDGGVQ